MNLLLSVKQGRAVVLFMLTPIEVMMLDIFCRMPILSVVFILSVI